MRQAERISKIRSANTPEEVLAATRWAIEDQESEIAEREATKHGFFGSIKRFFGGRGW